MVVYSINKEEVIENLDQKSFIGEVSKHSTRRDFREKRRRIDGDTYRRLPRNFALKKKESRVVAKETDGQESVMFFQYLEKQNKLSILIRTKKQREN
jgi:hypothetical protein